MLLAVTCSAQSLVGEGGNDGTGSFVIRWFHCPCCHTYLTLRYRSWLSLVLQSITEPLLEHTNIFHQHQDSPKAKKTKKSRVTRKKNGWITCWEKHFAMEEILCHSLRKFP